jgi:DMSO/TMAO reductase YedYZ molybdopterin-dependent catalytic subunit
MISEPTDPAGEKRQAGLGGAMAAAVAFGVSELLAGILGSPSLIQGVADRVVDTVPPGVKDWAISTFGTNDKPALVIGIVLVGMVAGAVAGIASRRTLLPAVLAFGGFGVLGALVTAGDPLAGTTGPWLIAIVAVAAGVGSLYWVLARKPEPSPAGTERDATSRRGFLKVTSLDGLALLTSAVGRVLYAANRAAASQRSEVTLASEPTTALPTGSDFAIEDLTPIVVPNRDFYRIDTAISIPRVDLASWTLSFQGMVDQPYQVNFDEVMAMPMVERYVTLSCVSNPVGGDLVGNARWLGVPLRDLLDRASPQAGAEQIVARSVDGFTVGFPIETAFDGREAMLAVGMNGEALPLEHGFPARLVVAGLYGYVSATKWISEIELTTWEGFDAYWIPRGWAKEAPVKTQSRIDTPRGEIIPGPRAVAGVAWAPDRGISRVEVQIDNGAWTEAELSEPLSKDAWRQWRLTHDFTTGSHRIRVRATDDTGMAQGETEVPPAPNGAEGWHTVVVTVA